MFTEEDARAGQGSGSIVGPGTYTLEILKTEDAVLGDAEGFVAEFAVVKSTNDVVEAGDIVKWVVFKNEYKKSTRSDASLRKIWDFFGAVHDIPGHKVTVAQVNEACEGNTVVGKQVHAVAVPNENSKTPSLRPKITWSAITDRDSDVPF